MKNKIIAFFLLAAGLPQGAVAQRLLSLDSCRAMALRNNKQLSISRVKQEVAANVRKSARTKYLPHVSALGGYEWTSKEISLLSDEQKETLSNLGTSLAGGIGGKVNDMMSQVPEGTWKMLKNHSRPAWGPEALCINYLKLPFHRLTGPRLLFLLHNKESEIWSLGEHKA